MTKEELYAKYPELLSNVYCGFNCGDGWLQLLDTAFGLIMGHLESINSHNIWATKNRNNIIPHPELKEVVEPIVAQVKEKFGGLRCYTDNTDKYIDGILATIESLSYHICEECGHPGQLRREGWYKTLCNDCNTKEARDLKHEERIQAVMTELNQTKEKRLVEKVVVDGHQEV